MSSLSVRLPESLHEGIRKRSKKDQISINQFIATAVAEKLAALDTADYMFKRKSSANKEAYLKILEKVKDVPADNDDQ